MGRACRKNEGEEKLTYDISGTARKKRPLGRPRRRWVNNMTNGY
jgi:hypothetical protein